MRIPFRNSLLAGLVCCAALALAGCGANDGDEEDDAAGGGGGTGGGDLEPTAPGIFHINEVMPSNATVVPDEGGAYPDYIEIYNAAEGASDLGGYWLSDVADIAKTQLSEGLVVPAGGVILLYADDDEEDEGPLHVGFNLNREGEAVVLFDPEGAVVESVDWTDATTDEAYTRFPDGTGDFGWCNQPTPGELNGSACGD